LGKSENQWANSTAQIFVSWVCELAGKIKTRPIVCPRQFSPLAEFRQLARKYFYGLINALTANRAGAFSVYFAVGFPIHRFLAKFI